MTFTTPFTAVPGEIITAAGWNTSARDNILHLWGFFGANPGTNNLVPVSNGATTGAWGLVPDAALADQKVSQLSAIITNAASPGNSGFSEIYNPSTGAPSASDWYILTVRSRVNPTYYAQLAMNYHAVGAFYYRLIIGGTPTAWYQVWHSGNDGAGSSLDAATLVGLVAGNGSGNVAVNNAVMNTNLNANFLAGLVAGNAAGNIPISNNVQSLGLNAQYFQGLVPGNVGGNVPINNSVQSLGLNAQFLAGLVAGNGNGNVAINNGTLNSNLNAQMLGGLTLANVLPVHGTYSGDNSARNIALTYSPNFLVIMNTAGSLVWLAMPGVATMRFASGSNVISTDGNVSISGASFNCHPTNGSNAGGQSYVYWGA